MKPCSAGIVKNAKTRLASGCSFWLNGLERHESKYSWPSWRRFESPRGTLLRSISQCFKNAGRYSGMQRWRYPVVEVPSSCEDNVPVPVLDITSRLLEEYSLWPSARRYQERKWIEVLPKKENVLVPVVLRGNTQKLIS